MAWILGTRHEAMSFVACSHFRNCESQIDRNRVNHVSFKEYTFREYPLFLSHLHISSERKQISSIQTPCFPSRLHQWLKFESQACILCSCLSTVISPGFHSGSRCKFTLWKIFLRLSQKFETKHFFLRFAFRSTRQSVSFLSR
jgi:hypothetical protein